MPFPLCLRKHALAPVVAILVVLAGCAPVRHYEAARVLQDFAVGAADSPLKRTTPEPLRQTLSFTVEGRTHQADLYLPAALQGCGVKPGAVPQGKDDPRMVAFATTLARAGFAVLAPDLPGYRELRIRPADAMVAPRQSDPAADLSQLAAMLSERMRADIDLLDLARRDLAPLEARLILVHGRNDNLIPWTESLALAAAAEAGQARVFLIRRLLGHVDLSAPDLLTWRFWHEDLPDLWRMWRVMDLLLAERGAGA